MKQNGKTGIYIVVIVTLITITWLVANNLKKSQVKPQEKISQPSIKNVKTSAPKKSIKSLFKKETLPQSEIKQPAVVQKEIEKIVEELKIPEIGIFQGFSSFKANAPVSISLKEDFPYNDTLQKSQKFNVTLIVSKMSGLLPGDPNAVYAASNGRVYDEDKTYKNLYAGIKNNNNEIEFVHVDWINEETIENFWSAHQSKTPADMNELRSNFSKLKQYNSSIQK